jgi:hypothetical protein
MKETFEQPQSVESGPEQEITDRLTEEQSVQPEKMSGMRRRILGALLAITGVAGVEGCTVSFEPNEINREALAHRISGGILSKIREMSNQARANAGSHSHTVSDNYSHSASLHLGRDGIRIDQSTSHNSENDGDMLGDQVTRRNNR